MIVLDTHAVLRLADDPRRLGRVVRREIDRADRRLVSAISAWELGTLVRRGRIGLPFSPEDWLRAAVVAEDLEIAPVTSEIAFAAAALDERFHGDPADRLIYATAQVHGCALASKDAKIASFDPQRTVW